MTVQQSCAGGCGAKLTVDALCLERVYCSTACENRAKLPKPSAFDTVAGKDIPIAPCPHCASPAALDPGFHPSQRSWVECSSDTCGMSGPSLFEMVAAVRAWNDLPRRAIPQAAKGAIVECIHCHRQTPVRKKYISPC